MRILIASNAPWSNTGYGTQTRLMVKHLGELGHEIAVACNYGLRGGILDGGGAKFYPAGYDTHFPNDVLQAHADDFSAEAIISIYDAWCIDIANLKTPWLAWLPIDHQPAPAHVMNAIKKALSAVSYSRFGYNEMTKAGADNAHYIPLGVETDVYTPMPRHEARGRLGLNDQAYIVGMVAANKTKNPSRKCIPQALQAFRIFKYSHPDALMYLHTEETGVAGGIHLKPLLDALNLGGDSLLLCDQYDYATGGFGDAYMRDIYNACDVLLAPSMSEGFGLPIIEAQACGTPVIATKFSSMMELVDGVGGGLIEDFEPFWSVQNAWQALPHVQGIVNALDAAYLSKQANEDANRAKAREKALGYDWKNCIAPLWDEHLKAVAQ